MKKLIAGKHLYKIYILLISGLLLLTLAMQREKLMGHVLWSEDTEAVQIATFSNDDIKAIFPNATGVEMRNDSIIILSKQEEIGWAYNTSPLADDIVGYASSVPLLIGFNNENKVEGLTLLKNYESPDFVDEIVQADFLSLWDDVPLSEIGSRKVDAFSGATLTSSAIIKTVKQSAGVLSQQDVNLSVGKSPLDILKVVLGYLLVALALVQFFKPQALKKYRTIYLLLIISILGFWSGTFLSLFTFENWLIHGIDLPAKLFIFIILILSIVLPLVTNKAFYCAHVCPFGAAQELVGKTRKEKVKLSPEVKEFLSTLREKIFAVIMLLLFLGVSFDLTNIEPFSAFLFGAAALPVIILAITFLIISVFVPKPWCRFACPTGFILESFRKTQKI